MENELLESLIKEYEIMRTEVRLYINKYYIGLAAIFGSIISGGIFQNKSEYGGLIYIWIPYVIAGIMGYMAMVTFFINKTAGYVRLIEQRIDRIFHASPPNKMGIAKEEKPFLAPFFWESYYADLGMDRDIGRHFKSIFKFPLVAIGISALSALIMVISHGCNEASKWHIYVPSLFILSSSMTVIIYLLTSVILLIISSYLFWKVNFETRKMIIRVNSELLEFYKALDSEGIDENNA